MSKFAVVPSRRFEDEFRVLPKDIQRQVLLAIGRFAANPRRGRRLKGVSIGEWRYRVGDCRIRYDTEGSTVYLHIVRHRRDVYR
jgi:mRNA-degrading endonuclease RelE of RelBE toxin-antitoxin system